MKKYSRAVAAVSLGVVLATSSIAPTAQAATNSELQEQINSLLALILKLQNQTGQGATSVASGICPYNWTRPLTVGASGADVQKLQQFLNADVDTRVSVSGAGSVGAETMYFGPATANAVVRFQNKYKSEVLTPVNLSQGTGFFGQSSIAKANKLCVVKTTPTTPSVPTTPTTPTNPTTPTTPTTQPSRSESSLEKFKTSSGEDTSLNEGQKNVEIMDVEFDVEEGDVVINRIDVGFDHQLGEETDPWKTFKDVSVYIDGKKVATKTVTNKADWTKDAPYAGAYRLRLSGLGLSFDEGDEVTMSVAVSLADSIDGSADGLSWNVFIPTQGIRGIDGSNSATYAGDNDEVVNIDINEAGSDDELSVKTTTADPDSSVLLLKDNMKSDWMTIFAFDLDTDDSESDIEVRKIPVQLTVSSSTVGTFVSDARIIVDGKTYTDVTMTDGTTNTMLFSFDRGKLVIDSGDRVPALVQVKFNKLAPEFEGTTIQGSVDAGDIIAEGADDLKANQLSGAATGDEHMMQTKGAGLAQSSNSATLKANSTSDITDDQGVFKVVFKVTAFESDLYINKSALNGMTLGTAGANYVVTRSDGSVVTDGAAISALSATAKTVGNQYRVLEGQTETFTLNVTFDPVEQDFYQVRLYSFNWATTASNPTTQQIALPVDRYETEALSI